MKEKPIIVWFRQDLRTEDHPALHSAIQQGRSVVPVFIWAPAEEMEWAPGAASRWWLHGSLQNLRNELEELGLKLIVRQQSSLEALQEIAEQTGASGVYWNRRYEPYAIQRDAHIKAELRKNGIHAQSFNGTLLFEPWTVLNKQNKPFQVFTPFWKHCCSLGQPDHPLPKPQTAFSYSGAIESVAIESLHLLPTIPWDIGLKRYWQPGVPGAQQRLHRALEEVIIRYEEQRDFPSIRGTSELSPYLHHGEISPRMVWHAVRQALGQRKGADVFLRQVGWREFAYHLLYHFPQTPSVPLHPKFSVFPWEENRLLREWQKGQTGYPIVDAGMRQLWETGWMHNRVRMIVGSFLVKDLLIDWKEGAAWFWDTLVDADLANNTLGWQWVAGCGADAAPYFRIFNPVTQGEKFDPEGAYVRRWIPEIASLPNRWIHKPWEAPEDELRRAGVSLGKTYPKPIIDHAQARLKALDAFAQIKNMECNL